MLRSRVLRALAPAALSLGVLLAACSGPSTGTEVQGHGTPEPVDRSAEPAAVRANAAMGMNLYHQLQGGAGNFVFSPYGVSTVLAMAQAGAAGTTASQLAAFQQVPTGADLDAGLNALADGLSQRSGEQLSDVRKGRVTLTVPTSLWGQKDTRFDQPFLDTLATSFGTGLRVVDFRSDPEASRKAMNSWVREQTDATIEELVPRGEITDVTRFVATTATSLQAPWDQPFDRLRSHPAPFTLRDGRTVRPVTMTVDAPTGLSYVKGDGWEAVGLPYLGRKLEMVVIAPDQGRFDEVERGFDGAALQQVVSRLQPTALALTLPRFGFTTQDDLAQAVAAGGAPDPFSPTDADFSGVTADERLFLSELAQQTFVSADEEGTEATASTVITTIDRAAASKLESVTIARPFLLAVIDRPTGEPILLGRVLDPTS